MHQEIGVETRTLIATVNLVYSDTNGDGLPDIATATTATALTDTDEIAVYFAAANRLDSDPVSEKYRIEPVKV